MKIDMWWNEWLFELRMMHDEEFFLTHNEGNFQTNFESAMEWKSYSHDDAPEWIWWPENHEAVVDKIKELASLYIDENIG